MNNINTIGDELIEIPEYPDYKINKKGEIYSLKTGTERFINGEVIKGYKRVSLRNQNGVKRFQVHRLVAQIFIPNPENKSQVNHIDGNKLNNHIDNLEWCTPLENTNHAWKLGLNDENQEKQYTKVARIDVESNVILEVHESMSDAASFLKYSGQEKIKTVCGNIRRAIREGHRTAYGYKWAEATRGIHPVPNDYKKNINGVIVSPTRATKSSAGYDITLPVDVELPPGKTILVWTDFCAFMLKDEVLNIYIRSSIGVKKGIVLANGTGIIDSDYYANENNFGNIGLPLLNTTNEPIKLKAGERVAQGVFIKYLISDLNTSQKNSAQRSGGFGSSGK